MDDKKNYYHNCHDGYYNPHCWCNDNYSGGGGNMGCFGIFYKSVYKNAKIIK